jgi:hypothetical protein
MLLKILEMLLVNNNRNITRRNRLGEGHELPARRAGTTKRIKPV